jgi:AraC family L-rhamnose operon regulatory protein RhaS
MKRVVHNSPRGETAKQRPPIFRAATSTYGVDTCRPQRDAIRDGKITLHALARGGYPGEQLPSDALRGVNSIGYWDAIGPQDWGLELHRNEGIEISFMETGGMPFVVENRGHELRAGDLTVTRPWQLHCHGYPTIGPGRIHWIIIDVGVRRPNQEWKWPDWVVLAPRDLKELTNRLRHLNQPVQKTSEAIQNCFRAIAASLADREPTRRISPITVYLNELLWHLLELLRTQRTVRQSRISPAEQTVRLFLRDLENNEQSLCEAWTLESMAKECGLGETAFARYCRLLTNTSPLHHLNRLRLQLAARMLREQPDRSITDIGFACGFNSSQYFSTQFHRHFKRTPKAYRAVHDSSP